MQLKRSSKMDIKTRLYISKYIWQWFSRNTCLVKRKMKRSGVAILEFVGLKPKIYSFLVDDSSEHKKAKDVNKNVVATISHNEY